MKYITILGAKIANYFRIIGKFSSRSEIGRRRERRKKKKKEKRNEQRNRKWSGLRSSSYSWFPQD